MNKTLVQLFAVCLIISGFSETFTKSKYKDNKGHRCCPCPTPTPPPITPTPLIVGSWVLNEILNELPSFAVLAVHSDGTLSLHRSLAIQQPAPVGFPTGNYSTIDEGIWTQRSTTVFQVISTSVVNIITTGIPEALQATLPLARAQTTLNIRVSDDGKTLVSVSGAMALYEIDDLTFTKPLLNPNTGLPFVTDITATGLRLAFSQLDTGP